jgi:fumarate hydratase subunit alpha
MSKTVEVIEAPINDLSKVEAAVARAVVVASTTFRPDQVRRYEKLIAAEKEPGSMWCLARILENSKAAQANKIPLCNDTGIPHVFLDVGDEAAIPAGFFKSITAGIAEGLRRLPGRPMGILGDDIQRMDQSAGLDERPEGVLPAPVQMRRVPGNEVRVTVLMLGGGPEIQGKTLRVFHKHSLEAIVKEMVAWAKEGTFKLGCTPATLAFGVGRTQVEAASLSLEAMRDADFDNETPLERRVTDAVNETGVGPLGLGGTATVLGTFVRVGPQRASGIRVVSLRVGCCYDPRRATAVLRN